MFNLFGKVAEIANKKMEQKAEQILGELHAAGYKYYPTSTRVVPSFTIQESSSEQVGGSFRAGLITKVRIGSNLREAYWAVYGNGGRGTTITSTREFDKNGRRPGKLGTYPGGIPGIGFRAAVSGYDGHNFVKEVADRHR